MIQKALGGAMQVGWCVCAPVGFRRTWFWLIPLGFVSTDLMPCRCSSVGGVVVLWVSGSFCCSALAHPCLLSHHIGLPLGLAWSELCLKYPTQTPSPVDCASSTCSQLSLHPCNVHQSIVHCTLHNVQPINPILPPAACSSQSTLAPSL